MQTRPILVAADVRVLMQAARTEAERRGFEVSIAVVDHAGVLLAVDRLDGARLHTPEAAWLKARTAAIVRSPTAVLQDQVKGNPALLAFPGRLPLAGGVPLLYREIVVGGVGSSGGSPEDDEILCATVLSALAGLYP